MTRPRRRRAGGGRLRAHVVFAHPDPASFAAHLRDVVVATLVARGHEVDLLDLYAEGFDPVLRADTWAALGPPGGGGEVADVAGYAERLRAADALVLVHPTWWSGQPAILKGWIDRVWSEGVAYERRRPSPWRRGRLRGVRHLVVVTTHGSPRRVNLVQGESGRRLVMRSLRLLVHPRARRRWVAYYGIDRDEPARRQAFVARVAAELGRL